MSKRRPSGDGMVRKREDGCWEGRIVIGHKENGEPIFRCICAGTQKELTAKLRQNINACQGVDLTEKIRMTLSGRLDRWLNQMASVPVLWSITAMIWSTMSSPALGKRGSRKSQRPICENSMTL